MSVKSLKQLLEREKKVKLIIGKLNNFLNLKTAIPEVMALLQELAQCDAIAIRLIDKDDFPYYAYADFPPEFIKKENRLCEDSAASSGRLECLCGLVASGKTDSALPCFTEKGSFYIDENAKLVNMAEQGRFNSAKIRNTCGLFGYNSIALVPIKSKGKILGVIQMNDRSKDKFSREFIDYMETIAEQLGIAIENNIIYAQLKEANRKINELNKQKSEFLGYAAHDLRNPLAVNLMYTSFILEKLDSNLTDKQKELLAVIRDTNYSMSNLINNFLEVSVIESGKLKLDITECDYEKLLDGNIRRNRIFADQKNISVLLDYPQNIKKKLKLDCSKIEQVLNNLIVNAIKYSPAETEISVKISGTQGKIKTSIIDRGPGIPEKELKNIFLDFYSLPGKKDSEVRSAGLGLAISKKIIEAHGGTMAVESKAGQGSAFSFELSI